MGMSVCVWLCMCVSGLGVYGCGCEWCLWVRVGCICVCMAVSGVYVWSEWMEFVYGCVCVMYGCDRLCMECLCMGDQS